MDTGIPSHVPGPFTYQGTARGRKPLLDDNGNPKMNYYHAIRASTANNQLLDPSTLTNMENEVEFDFCPFTREDLILHVKHKANAVGFRAIIPFADRNNKCYASTAFACCMSGISVKKASSGCPFKVTYVKQHQEGFYRMATEPQDTFLKHNHALPVDDD